MPDTDTILMVLLSAVSVVMFSVLAVGGVLMVWDTIRKSGNWGINLDPPPYCPECDDPLPQVRVPTSWQQALWGGNTCRGCGAEIDKWGKVISVPKRPSDEDFREDNDV